MLDYESLYNHKVIDHLSYESLFLLVYELSYLSTHELLIRSRSRGVYDPHTI